MARPVAVEQAVQPHGEYKPEDTDPEAMSGTLPHGCSALLKEWLREEAKRRIRKEREGERNHLLACCVEVHAATNGLQLCSSLE